MRRSASERRTAGLRQQHAGPARLIGLDGQSGGQVPGYACQSRLGRLQRGQGSSCQRDPPGREQVGCHRFPGEHVPEPEDSIVYGEQLYPHAVLEGGADGIRGQSGGLREQPPVELPPEQGGGVQHQPSGAGQAGQPDAHSVSERARHARRGQ